MFVQQFNHSVFEIWLTNEEKRSSAVVVEGNAISFVFHANDSLNSNHINTFFCI